MDLKKLKKRASYPFETIAVAFSFSPRLEAIVAEAGFIADRLKSNLIFIHIGTKTNEKEDTLDKFLSKYDIDKNKIRIIWMEGDPVETILQLCKLNVVDLLILGALEKENIVKYYLGSVARTISRKAKSSVLLLTHPSVEPRKIGKIIINGIESPKTIHTLNTALYLAKSYDVKEVTLVKESNVPTLAMTVAYNSTAPEVSKMKRKMIAEEELKLNSIIKSSERNSVKINEKIITGKPGYAISNYAKIKHADLLVINSPDTHLSLLDRIFTHDIEYILANLPCNLLIVHSRV